MNYRGLSAVFYCTSFFCLICLLFCCETVVNAQPFLDRKPVSWNYRSDARRNLIVSAADVKTVIAHPISLDSIIAKESELNRRDIENAQKGIPISRPYLFGYPIDAHFDMNSSGTWDDLPDGGRLWRLRIFSPGAYSLSLAFDKFYLPKDAFFFIYNEGEAQQQCLGAFYSAHNSPKRTFVTAPLRGSVSVLEYYEPSTAREEGQISIHKITHGYKDVFAYQKNLFPVDTVSPRDKKASGATLQGLDCQININCSQGANWQQQKRAVGCFYTDYGTGLCSGALVNNTLNTIYSPIAYFLTARHCLTGGNASGTISADVTNFVFQFNYEYSGCSSSTSLSNGDYYYGSDLVASWNGIPGVNEGVDFALLKIRAALTLGSSIYLAGWSRITPSAGESVVGIHHPNLLPKQIFIGSSPQLYSGTGWIRTARSMGQTTGGSSGSPLFNSQKLIVGPLSAGYLPYDCNVQPYYNFYGRLDLAWEGGGTPNTRLKDWLANGSSSVFTYSGLDLLTGTYGLNNSDDNLNRITSENNSSNTIDLSVGPMPISSVGAVAYTLPEDATMTLEILSLMHGKVATLITNNANHRGWNEEIVNIGHDLPNGSYSIRLVAVGVSGKVYTGFRKFIVIR